MPRHLPREVVSGWGGAASVEVGLGLGVSATPSNGGGVLVVLRRGVWRVCRGRAGARGARLCRGGLAAAAPSPPAPDAAPVDPEH